MHISEEVYKYRLFKLEKIHYWAMKALNEISELACLCKFKHLLTNKFTWSDHYCNCYMSIAKKAIERINHEPAGFVGQSTIPMQNIEDEVNE